MKKNLTQLLLGLCLAMVSFPLSSQTSCINYFNDILVKPAMCGDENGSITIASETAGVDFLWNDGSTELNRENLPSGIYTVVGEDEKGCQEEITLSIPDFSECEFYVYETYPPSPPKIPGKDPCVTLNLIVYQNGTLVPLDNFYISWTATNSEGSYTSSEGSIDVFQNETLVELVAYYQFKDGTVVPCCVHSEQRLILDACPVEPKVYVYKSNFGDSDENTISQFELFVYGTGVCGETMDLRGYIIDDNNGELIPPSESIGVGTLVNANAGYIKFSDHENWAAVPNGSFINFYDSGDIVNPKTGFNEPRYPELIKLEDPTDANDDGVYVVGISSTIKKIPNEYVDGYFSFWDLQQQVIPYTAKEKNQTFWPYIYTGGMIRIGMGDAKQIRNPDGTYHHGVAHGITEYSVRENEFPLHITYDIYSSFRIHMDRLSHDDKTAYSVVPLRTPATFTPGTIESPDIQKVVDKLRSCKGDGRGRNALTSNEVNEIRGKEKSFDARSLEVHPNPFKQYLEVTFKSDVHGKGTINVLNNQGRLIKTLEVDCTTEVQQQRIDFGLGAASGLYFIQLQYPNSKTKTAKAVLMSDN